jgi:Flp pilus assembly protein TadD
MSGLGTALYHQGKNDEAAEVLRQAINVSPNDSHTRSLLGVVYIRQGNSDDAYSELTRAVALDPRNAEAHNYLGIVMSEKGWGAAGEQEIQRAVELNPQYADAQFNLAVLYARAKNPRLDLARSHYQKAIDLGAAPDAQLETLLKSAPGN